MSAGRDGARAGVEPGAPPVRSDLAAALRLRLLGGFELRCEGDSIELPMSAQRLIAFLALQSRPLLRVHIAGRLWADVSERRACANLRTAVWRAHRPGHALVEVTNSHLALAPGVAVDVREIAARARRMGRRPPHYEEDDLEQLSLAGDLLPDWYSDWVLMEREQLHELRVRALEALCEALVLDRRLGEAAEAGLAALASEPLRESAHRALIRLHIAEGNRCDAIRQYRRYRELMRRELGIEPSIEIERLVAAEANAQPTAWGRPPGSYPVGVE